MVRNNGESEAVNPKRRVLVAEDESIIRMDVVDSLVEAGYEVVGEAANGEEAVEQARMLQPDVVVMDVKMPVMDGIAAAKIIGAENIAPVVLLTAFSQPSLVDQATEAGIMAYVVKPFVPERLLPAIEVALSRFEQMNILRNEISDLSRRFETRKLVDRAKGLLMENMGLSESDAFRWIQKTSMDRRLTMQEVAEAVITQVQGK